MEKLSSIMNSKVDLKSQENRQHFLEQYRIFIDASNRSDDRRIALNNFYLTANSLIVSGLGALSSGYLFPEKNLYLNTALIVIGSIMVLTWVRTMHTYFTINKKHYHAIKEFEIHLPSQVFTSFYNDISRKENKDKNKNAFLLEKETWIPYIFLVGYIGYFLADMYSLLIGVSK